jgi:MFS family permease
MTETVERPGVRPELSEPRLRRTLGVNYLCCQFGKFSLMPVLAVMLARGSGGNASAAGFHLFAFLLCVGLSSLLVSRWLPRLPYSTTMAAGMVCSAVGFGALAFTSRPVPVLLALCLAGFGNSIHGVLVRVLVADSLAGEPARNTVYGILQIATNVAAALGPFIAGVLYVSGNNRPLLGFVSIAYLVAAVTLLVGLPTRPRPPSTIRRTDGARARIRMVRDPECLRALALTAAGAFAYGQFYSAFALFVALAIDSPMLRAVLLGGPPILIVPITLLAFSVIAFGAGIVLLGVGLPVVVGAAVAVAVFALAEMLFGPMVSIAFNRLTNVSPITSSNLQGVSLTSGEALGSLFGGAVFLACYHHGGADWYWLALGTATIAGVGLHLTRARTTTVRPDEGH